MKLAERMAFATTPTDFALMATDAVNAAAGWINDDNQAVVNMLTAVFLETRALRITLEEGFNASH